MFVFVAVEGLLFVGAAEAASLISLCWDEGVREKP